MDENMRRLKNLNKKLIALTNEIHDLEIDYNGSLKFVRRAEKVEPEPKYKKGDKVEYKHEKMKVTIKEIVKLQRGGEQYYFEEFEGVLLVDDIKPWKPKKKKGVRYANVFYRLLPCDGGLKRTAMTERTDNTYKTREKAERCGAHLVGYVDTVEVPKPKKWKKVHKTLNHWDGGIIRVYSNRAEALKDSNRIPAYIGFTEQKIKVPVECGSGKDD